MSSIGEFFKNLIDALLSGSFDRKRIIDSMNQSFAEYYYSGMLDRLCRVGISIGNSDFHHEMSAVVLRSGFKMTIYNDSGLTESEMREIAMYVLSNRPFVRQLMALGFDTLYVEAKNTGRYISYALKDYRGSGGGSIPGRW